MFNINGGLELAKPSMVLSIYGTNILDEQYVTSAGNTGSLFGVPTFVPGAPKMWGAKLKWTFGPNKNKSLQRNSPAIFKRRGQQQDPLKM